MVGGKTVVVFMKVFPFRPLRIFEHYFYYFPRFWLNWTRIWSSIELYTTAVLRLRLAFEFLYFSLKIHLRFLRVVVFNRSNTVVKLKFKLLNQFAAVFDYLILFSTIFVNRFSFDHISFDYFELIDAFESNFQQSSHFLRFFFYLFCFNSHIFLPFLDEFAAIIFDQFEVNKHFKSHNHFFYFSPQSHLKPFTFPHQP